METLSLLRLTPLRLLGLLVVSGVGSFIAATLVLDQPSSYTSTATAFVGSALPPNASAFDVGPFVSDFEATVELAETRNAVAERAGIPEAQLDLTTKRNGEGSSVSITSAHHDADVAEQTAADAATSAMMFLAGQRSGESTDLVTNRTAEVEAARTALTTFENENNFVDPAKEYEILQQQAIELRLQADDRSNDYTIAQRQALLEQVSSIRKSLPSLAAQRDEITRLRDRLARAEQRLRDAESTQTGIESALAGAGGDSVITAAAEEQSKVPQIVQAVVATTIVVFGLGIALFFLADALLKRGRRKKGQATQAAETADQPVDARQATVDTPMIDTPATDRRDAKVSPTPPSTDVETPQKTPTAPAAARAPRPEPTPKPTANPSDDLPSANPKQTSSAKSSDVRQPPGRPTPPIVPASSSPTPPTPKKSSAKGEPAKVGASNGASSNGRTSNGRSSIGDKPSSGLDRKSPRKINKRPKNDENGSDND